MSAPHAGYAASRLSRIPIAAALATGIVTAIMVIMNPGSPPAHRPAPRPAPVVSAAPQAPTRAWICVEPGGALIAVTSPTVCAGHLAMSQSVLEPSLG